MRTIKWLIGVSLLGVITSGAAYWFSSATLPNEPRIDVPAVVDLGSHEMRGPIEGLVPNNKPRAATADVGKLRWPLRVPGALSQD